MDPVKIDPVAFDRVEIKRKIMSQAVVEKTWEVPAHGDKGPVTITLRYRRSRSPTRRADTS